MHDDAPLLLRIVIGCDVEDYSSRDAELQGEIQSELHKMFAAAFQRAGLDYSACDVMPTGDGAFLVLPPGADLVPPVDRFVPELHHLLRLYNGKRVPRAQIRLRVAVHVDAMRLHEDPADSGGLRGYPGPALVVLRRLLDSGPVRRALAETSETHLALMVSAPLYEKLGQAGTSSIPPEHFEQVTVDIPEKRFRSPAYVYLPGHPARGRTASPPSDVSSPSDPAPAASPESSTVSSSASPGAGRPADTHGGESYVSGDGSVTYAHSTIKARSFTGRDSGRS